jgi:hypothetical protein
MLQTGSRGSLGPEAISDLLKRNSNDCIFGYPDMVREEIYCEKDGRWMDLATYFLGK